MPLAFYLFLALIIGLPVAWLISEFRGNKSARITLGVLSILLVSFSSCSITKIFGMMEYNATYGAATGELIRTSVQQMEDGNSERVLKVWRGLDRQYHPTYENKANYRELSRQAVSLMRGETEIEPKSAWNASIFTIESWYGFWEDDFGFWLGTGKSFTEKGDIEIIRSGDPPSKLKFVSVSPDFSILKIQEDDRLLHTLTLKNKYEAIHMMADLKTGEVFRTETLHKLIRATAGQKRTTEQ